MDFIQKHDLIMLGTRWSMNGEILIIIAAHQSEHYMLVNAFNAHGHPRCLLIDDMKEEFILLSRLNSK